MKTIPIEWQHFETRGRTCERCGATGQTLRRAVRRLNRECRGVRFELTETRTDAARIATSNAVRIGGHAIEDLLPPVSVASTDCASCGELTGKSETCRALQPGGATYESLPEAWIIAAACRAARCCPAA